MKLMINKKSIVAVIASAVLVSCNLDLVPSTAIVYEESEKFFQTESDIQHFYNGVLASYRSLCSGSFDITTDVMVDYFNATTGFGNNYGPVHRADQTFTPGDTDVESIWGAHYSAIKNYNIAISLARQVDKDSDLKPMADYLESVAYFCRASAYLTLTRLFGVEYDPDTASEELSVPLIVEYDQDAVPQRNTVEEVYMQIEEDLTFAEDVLADVPGMAGSIEPTADAVNALWARYYLDIHEYDDALKAAASVINSQTGNYALASTREEMQNEYLYDGGTEPVIQLYAGPSEGTVSHSVYTMVGYDEDEGKYFSPYFIPSATLVDAYDPSDLRYQTWFSSSKYPMFMNGSYYEGITIFTKYIGNENFYSGLIEVSVNAAKPIMISEMYLIAAEAAYMENEAPSINSTKYLNELQNARKAGATEGTLENIKKEWFKEMVGSGHRYVCLKRWGDGIPARPAQAEATNLVMEGAAYDQRTIDPGDRIFNLPIPSYEIKITPSLGQNEGYSDK